MEILSEPVKPARSKSFNDHLQETYQQLSRIDVHFYT